MATEILNEAEKFLLKNWPGARKLEESMEKVRTKYKEIFERIVEAVSEAHPELDANSVWVTQFWGDGSIAFGRSEWPVDNSYHPPGFWIDALRLETLSSDEIVPPTATIWISTKTAKIAGIDLSDARVEIYAQAQLLLSDEELSQCGINNPDKETLLSFPMPSKKELLGMFADGDGQRFVACFLSRLDMLAKFVPALDKLFSKHA